MTELDRRSFLAALGVGVIGLAGCTRHPALAAQAIRGGVPGKRRLDRIGIQMYTVRNLPHTDLSGTLAKLAGIGYKEVEWWGTYGLTPKQVRGLLDQNGLVAPSVHIGVPRTEDGWGPVFESAHALGHDWIVVASPPFDTNVPDDWKRLAALFNNIGKRVKDAGFKFAFHNEGMNKGDGNGPFEILLAGTDPSLVWFQLDVHWAYNVGADPIALLTKYPKRFRLMHVKDSTGAPNFKMTNVGAGTVPWAKVLDAASRAGVEHFYIEHDFIERDVPPDPLAFAKASFDYLSALEF